MKNAIYVGEPLTLSPYAGESLPREVRYGVTGVVTHFLGRDDVIFQPDDQAGHDKPWNVVSTREEVYIKPDDFTRHCPKP